MGTRTELVRRQASSKGWSAFLAGGVTFASVWFLWPLTPLAVLAGVAGGALTAKRTWEWLRFRGEWGLRF